MTSTPTGSRRLPLLGVALSAWAVLPPYAGPSVEAAARAEVVDHVVPAGVLLLVCCSALLAARRRPAPAMALLAAALTGLLCGLWMTATHLPLVVQAARQDSLSWLAVGHHSLPGLAVLALGLVWSVRSWAAAEPVSAS